MRKFLKTVLFLFALSSIAYAEDDAMAILNKKRAVFRNFFIISPSYLI